MHTNRALPAQPGRIRRRWYACALGLLLIAALLLSHMASQGAHGSAQETASVAVGDNFYDPNAVTVQAGATVTWTNNGLALHTVTSDDGVFDSGYNLAPGTTFSFTFANPGTYPYHCLVHGTIQSGTVTVLAAETPTPPPTPEPTPAPTPVPATAAPTASETSTPVPSATKAAPSITASPTGQLTSTASASPTATAAAEDSGGGGSPGVLLVVAIVAGVIALAATGYYAFRRMRGTL